MKGEPRIPSIWEPMLALVLLIAALAALLVKNAGYLTRVFALVLTVGLLGGCAAPGRFVLARWDSRSPEQLVSAQATDTAVYGGATAKTPDETKARFTEWVALAKVIGEFRTLLEFGVVEWGNDTRPFAVTEEPAK